MDLAERLRSWLHVTLGFLQLPPRAPELQLLHRWLDTWAGIGLIAVGLHRQGWDLQLTQYGDGHWRATFYVTGAAHSIVGGSAWEPTPWRAVQRAAWSEQDGSEVLGTGRKFTNWEGGRCWHVPCGLLDSGGGPLRRESSAAHPGDRRL
jgi:hypothetical protein